MSRSTDLWCARCLRPFDVEQRYFTLNPSRRFSASVCHCVFPVPYQGTTPPARDDPNRWRAISGAIVRDEALALYEAARAAKKVKVGRSSDA